MFQKLLSKVGSRNKASKSLRQMKTEGDIQNNRLSNDSDYHLRTKKSVPLPEDFAQKLIELEIQCERPDATKDHANQLMDLYTIAIEHYNCRSDFDNQMFFQSKLTQLLNRHDIQQLVDQKPEKEEAMEDTADGETNNKLKKQEKLKLREKQIERKRFEDGLKLSIFNQEKQNEPEKEMQIEDHIQQQKEAIKVVQREQIQMSEQFRKRLLERQKKQNLNRSTSASKSLNQSLNLHYVGIKKETVNEAQMQNEIENEELNDNFDPHFINQYQNRVQRKYTLQKKPIQKFASAGNYGAPIIQGSSLTTSGPDASFFSCGKSVGTNGGGIVNKISLALSRVVWNRNNNVISEDEEVEDLLSLVEELNQHSDLTVKLNNQSRICKILETNDQIFFPNTQNQAAAAQVRREKVGLDINVKGIMDQCKTELEKLQNEREQAIEEFLDKLAEEKIQGQQEIKMKYNRLINMLKNGKDPKKDEKVANNEEKKLAEIEEFLKEHNVKKATSLAEIKEKYNQLSKQIKIDAIAIAEALRKKQMPGAVESPIKGRESVNLEKINQHQQVEYGLDSLNEYKAQHRESTGYIGNLRPQV